MTIRINETEHDHIPEEFTVENLKEGGMTDQEIEALASGDDPLLTLPDSEAEQAKPEGDPDDTATIGTEPQKVEAQEAPVQEQAAPQDVPDPAMPDIPDTNALQEAITKADTDLDALTQRYDDGELSREEFQQQQRDIIAQQARAQIELERAGQVIEQANQTAVQHWQSRLDAYKATAPELWGEEHVAGWDKSLRAVTGNPAYVDLNRDAQIKLAHRLYAAEYEARTGKALSAPTMAKEETKKQDAKFELSKEKRPDPVSTLSGYNSDTGAEVEDSTFAAVDRLIMKDPVAAEKAFERMTPEQQERWLTEV